MRLTVCILLILYTANTTKGQCNGNLWHFGSGKSLDFTTEPPTYSANGTHNLIHDAIHFHDKKGNLLYYTDLRLFYNAKNEEILELPYNYAIGNRNGCLIPDNTNSSRLYLIKQTNNEYDLFHLELGHPDPKKRIISQTTLWNNDHFGGIASYYYPDIQKTIVVLTYYDSASVFIFHANGTFEKLPFNTHSVGTYWRDPTFSPSGKFFTLSYQNTSDDDRYDTNVYIVNPENIDIQLQESIKHVIGQTCFSPNERFIYTRNSAGDDHSFLQFDLATKIKTVLFESTYQNDYMQVYNCVLRPDGKIYGLKSIPSFLGKRTLCIIQKPDQAGAACSLELDVVDLGRSYIYTGEFIKPNYLCLASHITMQINGKYCIEDQLQFKAIAPQATAYNWDFGDGTFGSQKTVEHSYASTGSYTVKLTATYADSSTLHTAYTFVVQERLKLTTIQFEQ